MTDRKLLDAQSMGASFQSRAYAIKKNRLERLSLHNVMTGSPDGLLQIQISNDEVEDGADVVNWIDYTGGSTQVLGVTQWMVNIRDLSFEWLRLVYVRTGSTGTITTTFTATKRF